MTDQNSLLKGHTLKYNKKGTYKIKMLPYVPEKIGDNQI